MEMTAILEEAPRKNRMKRGVMLAWIRENVDYDGEGCLIWPFTTFKGGYGRLSEPGSNRTSTAARIMCIEAHGPPDDPKLHARHLCGNGIIGCVHPKHLAWGTVLENAADRVEHGRSLRGTQNRHARLDEDDVREIRAMLEAAPANRIAQIFDVALPTVKDIKAKRTWAWLD